MVNYTHHRTMLEAWNSKTWNPATGLMLWMTHPAWPSNVWQIYSSDYDTHAAFYGFQKAAEPLHVQWNLDTDEAAVVNHLSAALSGSTVTLRFYGLDGKELAKRTSSVNAPGNATTVVSKIEWPAAPALSVVFLKLEWRDAKEKLLSENFYWRSEKPTDLIALNQLPAVTLDSSVRTERRAGEIVTTVSLTNPTKDIALMTHLVLRDRPTGAPILPAYYSDNYVSLLPGEQHTVTVTCAEKDGTPDMKVGLEG